MRHCGRSPDVDTLNVQQRANKRRRDHRFYVDGGLVGGNAANDGSSRTTRMERKSSEHTGRHDNSSRFVVEWQAHGLCKAACRLACPQRRGSGTSECQNVQAKRLAGEACLAIAEVVVEGAEERVVEAQRAHDGVRRNIHVGSPASQRLRIVQAKVLSRGQGQSRAGSRRHEGGDGRAAAAGEDECVDHVAAAHVLGVAALGEGDGL